MMNKVYKFWRLVEQPLFHSLHNIGRQFGINEFAIRSLIKKKDGAQMHSQQKDQIQEKQLFEDEIENTLNERNACMLGYVHLIDYQLHYLHQLLWRRLDNWLHK